jgi:NADH-quinone oxidoreductase subunit E
MKSVLLFFLMIMAAVFLGLAIAFWYVSRFVDNGGPVRKPPRAVPFRAKHRPVDVTPKLASVSRPSIDATVSPDSADVDGLMQRLAAIEAEQEQQRPTGSAANQFKDDLKRISGIGPKLEGLLNANGIFSFRQISAWQEADIRAIDDLLPAFRGRVQRDDWVGQARRLLDGDAARE